MGCRPLPCLQPGSVAYSRGFNQLLDELAALSALQAEAAAELVELVKREAHALAAESGGSLSVRAWGCSGCHRRARVGAARARREPQCMREGLH